MFIGGSGQDRFVNIGQDDIFIGGSDVDAVVFLGIKPSGLGRAGSAEIDSLMQVTSGTSGNFLRIQTGTDQFFYLSEVEYLEFSGDGSRIDLQSFYGQYTQGVL
jgi:hypothetical protein